MAMRAQMAKAVTKGAKRVSRKKQKNLTMMQAKEEEDEGGEQNVEDSTKFWLGVAEHMEKYRYERAHPVKDPREEKRQSRLSRMSKRRPSLQLSEKLKLIKPKVMVPSFVKNAIDNIPVISPNHTLKVRSMTHTQSLSSPPPSLTQTNPPPQSTGPMGHCSGGPDILLRYSNTSARRIFDRVES